MDFYTYLITWGLYGVIQGIKEDDIGFFELCEEMCCNNEVALLGLSSLSWW